MDTTNEEHLIAAAPQKCFAPFFPSTPAPNHLFYLKYAFCSLLKSNMLGSGGRNGRLA
jgi:hypothetical protein